MSKFARKKSIKMIEEFSNAFGVSGFEDDVVKVGLKYGEDFAKCSFDSLKNLIVDWEHNKEITGRPVILLDAHLDEVGFMVQAILKNGLIKFLPLGGWLSQNLSAHSVIIRNSEQELVKGIISTKPPHFMSLEEKKQVTKIEELLIDIGSTSYEETVDIFKIGIGNPIVPDVKFIFNEKNGMMSGKAFDNRIGCAAVLDIIKILDAKKELAVNVIGGLSAQEEVGARGIKVTTQRVKPDLAIVFEGTPADDTFFRSEYETQGALRKGPQIRHLDNGMIANPEFIKFAKKIASKNNIHFQEAVRKGGMTNGSVIHLSSIKGVPTLVLGIPDRYAHTHNNFSAIEDYEATVLLAKGIIESLTPEIIASFFNLQ